MFHSTIFRINICLFFLVLIYMIWPFWRIFLPLEIDFNEAWNGWFIKAAMGERALYPNSNELIINNYPPLSFLFLAFLAKLFSVDSILIGRLVSYLSLLLLSISVYLSALNLGAKKSYAIYAALFLCATFARFFWRYVGMNDPMLFSLALMGMGLAWFLYAFNHKLKLYPALTLMVLAGFFKHNLIIIPLTCLIFVFLQDKAKALKAAFFGICLSLLGLWVCYFIYGYDFFYNLLTPRDISFHRTLIMLGRLQWVAVALIVSCLWLYKNPHSNASKFLIIFISLAFVGNILQRMGAGVDNNAQFELVIACSLGLALAMQSSTVKMQILIASLVTLRLFASTINDPYQVIISSSYREKIYIQSLEVGKEVERVKNIEGNVVCSKKTVCYLAGKSFVFDSFNIPQRYKNEKKAASEIQKEYDKAKLIFINVNPTTAWQTY